MGSFLILETPLESSPINHSLLGHLLVHTAYDQVAGCAINNIAYCVATRSQPVDKFILEYEGVIWLGCGHLTGMPGIPTFQDAFRLVSGDDDWYEKLRGHFAAARINVNTGEIMIATNRFGSVPVFWAKGTNGYAFSTELTSCLIASGTSKELDLAGVAETLIIDVPLGDRTLFRDVKQLPAASLLKFTDNGISIEKYWYYKFYSSPITPDREIIGKGYYLTQQAVKNCLPKDQTVAIFVSGGMDSRLIAGCALPYVKAARTISFGVKGSWDLIFGQKVSRCAGSKEHINFEIEPWNYIDASMEGVGLTGGMLSPAHFHMFGFVRHNLKPDEVILTGYLGDPHFGADSKLSRSTHEDINKEIIGFKNRFIIDADKMNSLFPIDINESLHHDLLQIMNDCIRHNLPSDFEEYYFITERQSKLIIYISSLCNMLEEVRLPFVDYELAEFLCTLPEQWRYKRRLQRQILIQYFPELAKIPESDTGAPLSISDIAKSIYLFRRKTWRGYQWLVEHITVGKISPMYPRWPECHTTNLRGPLKNWFFSHLDNLEKRELFPKGLLTFYRQPFMDARHDMIRFRLISLEQILQWCERWPRISFHN